MLTLIFSWNTFWASDDNISIKYFQLLLNMYDFYVLPVDRTNSKPVHWS